MSNVNKCILVGNLGKDVELRYTEAGTAVTQLTMATNRTWRDKDNNKKEEVQWHRIVVWGKQAQACAEYLGKGSQVYVEGRIQTRKWTDKEGVERYTTEVVAEQVQFLGRRKKEEEAPLVVDDDGLPF